MTETYHSNGEVIIDDIQRRRVSNVFWVSSFEQNWPPKIKTTYLILQDKCLIIKIYSVL